MTEVKWKDGDTIRFTCTVEVEMSVEEEDLLGHETQEGVVADFMSNYRKEVAREIESAQGGYTDCIEAQDIKLLGRVDKYGQVEEESE